MAPQPPFANRHPLLARAHVSALIWMLLLPFPMWADPVFDSGSAAVSVNGVLQTVDVNGNNQVLQWQSFVIDAGDTSQFNLGAANFNVLNVVDPTQALAGGTEIYGILSSNGHVFLADPAGVLIGPGGMVDTPGFYAIGGTVLNPATGSSFLGSDVFNPNNLDVNATAPVIHQGTIKAGFGGKVALVGAALEQGAIDAPGVSVTGTISVPNGTLTLVSGQGDIKLVNLLSSVSVTFPGTTPGTTDLSNGIIQAGTVTGQGLDMANNPTGADSGIGVNLVAADVYALGVNTDGFATGGGNVTIQANTAQVNGKLDLTDPDAGDPKGNFQGPTTLTAAAGDLEIVANDIISGDHVAQAGGVKLAADNDVAVGAVTAAQALVGSTNAIEMTAANDVRASGKIEAATGDILVQADTDNDMAGVIDVKDAQVNASDIVMTGPSVTTGNLMAVNGGIDLHATAGNVVSGTLNASDPLANAAAGDAIRITANGNPAVPNDGFVSIQGASITKGDLRITADGADAAGVGIQSAGLVDVFDGGVVITATGGDVFMGSDVSASMPVGATRVAVNIQSCIIVTVNGRFIAT
jgi:filamentous hemagglutinin family protein